MASKKDPKKCVTPFCRKVKRKGRNYCEKCQKRRWRLGNPDKAAYRNLQDSARKRGIEFRLSFLEFMLVIAGTGYTFRKGVKSNDLHIDRLDSSKGYVYTNLRVTTGGENIAKGNRERYLSPDARARLARLAAQEDPPYLGPDNPDDPF